MLYGRQLIVIGVTSMVKVKWFGHSAFAVKIGNKVFLVDPWITNPKSPIKDLSELSIEPDYILVTHDHGDHLGNTVELLKLYKKAKAVAIFEIANQIAEKLSDPNRIIDGNIGGPIRLGEGFFVVLTTATHSSGSGSPTGVVFGREGEVVYHAGDTGLTYDMKLVGELYKPLVALLPIGGHYTMGPKEAAKAAELIKPKYAIPMHYGTFPVLWGKPEDFKNEVAKLAPEVEVIILSPGEEVELT